MRIRLSLRGLVPVLAVSAIVGLAFLAPARAGLNSVLATYSYSYPGPWTSGPDAAATTGTNMDVFISGAGGATYDIHWDGSTFSGATSLGGISTADPGAITNPATGKTYVFVRGTDTQGYYKLRVASWGPWVAFGGRLIGGPDVSLRAGTPGIYDVWVRGTDNQLYHKWSPDDGVHWYGWEALGGRLTFDPTAVSWDSTRVDVFVRGTDNQLYHKWWYGTAWAGWEALSGILTSSPDAASCQARHLDVFVRGTDGAIYQRGFNGASWVAWSRLGGSWSSGPSAICRPGTNLIDVFARDGLGNLDLAFEVNAT